MNKIDKFKEGLTKFGNSLGETFGSFEIKIKENKMDKLYVKPTSTGHVVSKRGKIENFLVKYILAMIALIVALLGVSFFDWLRGF